MARPEIILGAGISGLIVAQRLRALKRPFLILERNRAPLPESGGRGFFYLHKPFFGDEAKFKIRTTLCRGGDPNEYARKVYGDPTYRPISIMSVENETEGWLLPVQRLLDGLDASLMLNTEVIDVRFKEQMVFTKDGRTWPFSQIHSTIPLPILLGLVGITPKLRNTEPLKFKAEPIYIRTCSQWQSENNAHPAASKGDEMHCHYCASDCHPWYRATAREGTIQEEYMTPIPEAVVVRPGKISHPANETDREEYRNMIQHYRNVLEGGAISTWGRYGTWTPKMLTSHVWDEAQQKLK